MEKSMISYSDPIADGGFYKDGNRCCRVKWLRSRLT